MDYFAAHRPKSADLAAIAFSPGTTGRPKGIMHTQKTPLEAAKGGQVVMRPITPDSATLLYMQSSFAADHRAAVAILTTSSLRNGFAVIVERARSCAPRRMAASSIVTLRGSPKTARASGDNGETVAQG